MHSLDNEGNDSYLKKDLNDGIHFVNQIIDQWRNDGYLAANIDSLSYNSDSLIAFLYKGSQYQWAKLDLQDISSEILHAIGERKILWENQKIEPKAYQKLNKNIIHYLENNGYPLAKTYLENQVINDYSIKGSLKVDKGKLIIIDSVIIEGEVQINKQFILNHIGIKEGDIYKEQVIKSVDKKINNLSFVQTALPAHFEFNFYKNKLTIYLKERKSNLISGIIGLQPNTEETNKFMLTADVNIQLKNMLEHGESIGLTYQHFQYKSPKFDAHLTWPYLLGSPFGLDAEFNLYKRDTLFRRTHTDFGILYHLTANNYLKLLFENQTNRIITPDTNFVKTQKKLPENIDVSTNGFGFAIHLDKTDFILNPTNGWQLKFNSLGLKRKPIVNNAFTTLITNDNFDFTSLYNSLESDMLQIKTSGTAAYYITIWKNIIGTVKYNGAYLSGKNLFLNELFQIGGMQLMRGFDEHSILAQQYHILSIEPKVIINELSYLYLFYDVGYTEFTYDSNLRVSKPMSFGLGLSLSNNNGVFNIAFAVGNSQANFEFRNTKVHIGYQAYF